MKRLICIVGVMVMVMVSVVGCGKEVSDSPLGPSVVTIVTNPQPIVDTTVVDPYTWTLANSPKIITSNFTVPVDKTLVIQPGVVVKLSPGIRVDIFGAIRAEGTSIQHIVFTRNGSEDWAFLSTEYAIGLSTLKYCQIEMSSFEVRLNSKVTMDHCKISKITYGLTIMGASVSYTTIDVQLALLSGSIDHCLMTCGTMVFSPYTGSISNSNFTYIPWIAGVPPEESSAVLNFQNNWWGTTDTSVIDSKIDDGKDTPGRAIIDYTGYKSASISTAGCGW